MNIIEPRLLNINAYNSSTHVILLWFKWAWLMNLKLIKDWTTLNYTWSCVLYAVTYISHQCLRGWILIIVFRLFCLPTIQQKELNFMLNRNIMKIVAINVSCNRYNISIICSKVVINWSPKTKFSLNKSFSVFSARPRMW